MSRRGRPLTSRELLAAAERRRWVAEHAEAIAWHRLEAARLLHLNAEAEVRDAAASCEDLRNLVEGERFLQAWWRRWRRGHTTMQPRE